MNHIYEIIYSDISLRPINRMDLEKMRCWRNSKHARPFFIHSSVISSDQQNTWFEAYLKKEYDLMFIVQYNNTDIGMVGLYNINSEDKTAEFGRLLIGEESYKGKRLGEKIVRAICKFGFEKLNLEQIYLEVLIDNQRALTIYETIGFVHQATKVEEGKILTRMILTNEHLH